MIVYIDHTHAIGKVVVLCYVDTCRTEISSSITSAGLFHAFHGPFGRETCASAMVLPRLHFTRTVRPQSSTGAHWNVRSLRPFFSRSSPCSVVSWNVRSSVTHTHERCVAWSLPGSRCFVIPQWRLCFTMNGLNCFPNSATIEKTTPTLGRLIIETYAPEVCGR